MSRRPVGNSWRRSATVAGCLTLGALLVAFLLPPGLLFCSVNTDMIGGYVASRAFSAATLASGHIPLWNPYTYGGQPFLGGFESGVLYPPNLLFLVLPLARALNFSTLLHLVLMGWGMERWANRRGLHPAAALLAGCILPLTGAVFPHVYAGHLTHLCTMAWAPWIFLGLEMWLRDADRRGLFLASAGACLQILAGHIQYGFYTGVAIGVYALVETIAKPALRLRALPAVAIFYLAAIAMGAAQLLAGWDALREGVRQQSLDYAFAGMFSFAPENFLTLVAPGFFGGGTASQPYWGRCYYWEMSIFVGAIGPVLILAALLNRDAASRRSVFLDLAVAGALLLLALGIHMPIFGLLFNFAPGFGHFRGWAKFIFPATLFLFLAIAAGASQLLREKQVPRAVTWTSLATGSVLALASGVLLFDPELISSALGFVAASTESYLPPATFFDAGFIHDAGLHGGLSLGLAALVLIATGVVLFFVHEFPVLRWTVPGLLVLEMIAFATGQLAVAQLDDAMPSNLKQFVAQHPGDYRVLDLPRANNGFLLGRGDLGGNNPSPLRRYAEFINFAEGADPDRATQYLPFKTLPPLFALLRFRYAFVPGANNSLNVVTSHVAPLPQFLLVDAATVLPGRDALFSAMQHADFDPRKRVLLESTPDPTPVAGAVGSTRLISQRAGELELEADTDQPALLLMTDVYDPGWHAVAEADSSQRSYALLPADYVLRAVPLSAGHHHLRITYNPPSFLAGAIISILAWIVWAGLLIWLVLLPRHANAVPAKRASRA